MRRLRNLEFVLRKPAPDSELFETGSRNVKKKQQSFRSFRVNILTFPQTPLHSLFKKTVRDKFVQTGASTLHLKCQGHSKIIAIRDPQR